MSLWDQFGQLQSRGEQAMQGAGPNEIDAHKSFLSEALSAVSQKGADPQKVTQSAGAGNTPPQQMNMSQLVSTTLQLALQHPEIVQQVAQKYPQAQGILNTVLGAGPGNATNSGVGDLVGRFL